MKIEACPCKHTKPCHPDCTCVKEYSSRGCKRCCTYGSKEQQIKMAELLASKIDIVQELTDKMSEELVNEQWKNSK